MRYVYRVVLTMLMLAVLVVLSACGPKSKTIQDHTITGDLTGLQLDESQAPTLIYKRPGAPSLAAYNRFIIDPIQINYNDPNLQELDPEQVGKMQQYFRDAMIKELRKGGYEVGTRSQANTMRISLTVSNLKAPKGGGAANIVAMGAGAVTGIPMPFAISVGEVTVEGVFREALSNRIDAVVVDRSAGSRTFNAKPWSTWADVEGAFDKWATGVREAVDQAHGR